MMKKQILFAFTMLFGLFAFSQNPPKQVADTFANKFTGASSVKWDSEKNNEWEAEFKLNGKEMSANFDNAGKWLETEAEVKKKDLPAEVVKAITLKFEGWEIEEAESIEKPDFKGYEIIIEKNDTETEILVTEKGEITIKKVSVEDEEDEKDHDNKKEEK